MTSLRVALKLSMVEVKPENSKNILNLKKVFAVQEEGTLISGGRKRKSSIEKDHNNKNSRKDKTSVRFLNNEISDDDCNLSDDTENSSVKEDLERMLTTNIAVESGCLLSQIGAGREVLVDVDNTNNFVVGSINNNVDRNFEQSKVCWDEGVAENVVKTELVDNAYSSTSFGPCLIQVRNKKKFSDNQTAMLSTTELHFDRSQSNRAAALLAKTRLTRSVIRNEPEETNADEAHFSNEVCSDILDAIDWVQCDTCGKWRSFSLNSGKILSEKWFCHLNTWDLRYNTCTAPEETLKNNVFMSPAINEVEMSQRDHQQSSRYSRGSRGRGRNAKALRSEDNSCLINDDELGSLSLKSERELAHIGNSRKNGIEKNTPNTIEPIGAVNWVMCNKCKKWRKVPEYICMEVLPEKWFCSLNTWSVAFARCSVKEEQDDIVKFVSESSETSSANIDNVFLSKSTKEYQSRRKPQLTTTNSNINATSLGNNIRKVSWVQCERKNCKKWRKVPATIDTKLFPDKWFCEMNIWDTDVASCDAPEVSDDEDDYQQTVDTRSQLILSNSKGPGTLSYRRIIFGTDGKIRSCFSEKNRNGYGIFSFSETQKLHSGDLDDYFEPTRRISFWWSSAYDESRNANMSSKRTERLSAGSRESDEFTKYIPPSTHLLDVACDFNGFLTKTKLCPMSWPKKISKAWNRLNKMTIFQREQADCVAVRSCYLAASTKLLSLPILISLLQSCRFLMEDVDACREFMDLDRLKRTLRRMEERELVSVTVTSQSVLTFELIPIAAFPNQLDSDHSKPLKLRKKFSVKSSDFGVKNVKEISSNVFTTHRFKQYSKYE